MRIENKKIFMFLFIFCEKDCSFVKGTKYLDMKGVFFLLFTFSLFSIERQSSYPYLSGDTWRFFANWRLSKNPQESFNPSKVKLGGTIFVAYDCFRRFYKDYLPKIRYRFVLITPNCESGTDNP